MEIKSNNIEENIELDSRLITKLRNKLNNSKICIEKTESNQKDTIDCIKTINKNLANVLETESNHIYRKNECLEKIEEMKSRISVIQEKLKLTKLLLLDAKKK